MNSNHCNTFTWMSGYNNHNNFILSLPSHYDVPVDLIRLLETDYYFELMIDYADDRKIDDFFIVFDDVLPKTISC